MVILVIPLLMAAEMNDLVATSQEEMPQTRRAPLIAEIQIPLICMLEIYVHQ